MVYEVIVDGNAHRLELERGAGVWKCRLDGREIVVDAVLVRRDGTRDASGPQKLVCPMPGKIVRLLVTEKSEVEAGQGIVVVEAMKMQNEIKSPKKGVVQKILRRQARR